MKLLPSYPNWKINSANYRANIQKDNPWDNHFKERLIKVYPKAMMTEILLKRGKTKRIGKYND
jgi:predicted SAM-dependent methyltransferase